MGKQNNNGSGKDDEALESSLGNARESLNNTKDITDELIGAGGSTGSEVSDSYTVGEFVEEVESGLIHEHGFEDLNVEGDNDCRVLRGETGFVGIYDEEVIEYGDHVLVGKRVDAEGSETGVLRIDSPEGSWDVEEYMEGSGPEELLSKIDALDTGVERLDYGFESEYR